MNNKKRYQILCRFQMNNPNPVIELFHNSVFELLIAVILSAQANDIQVNKVTQILFSFARTPQEMLRFGINNIIQCIRSIGLFNIKSKNIIKISHILIDKYDSLVPENREILESFPGVGRKTANIILNTIFGWPTIAVDTHVFRFCNRSGFAKGKNVFSVEKKLLSVVPKKFKYYCHQWFVLHGRHICQSKHPHCNICIIHDLCDFKDKKNRLLVIK